MLLEPNMQKRGMITKCPFLKRERKIREKWEIQTKQCHYLKHLAASGQLLS